MGWTTRSRLAIVAVILAELALLYAVNRNMRLAERLVASVTVTAMSTCGVWIYLRSVYRR